MIERVLLVLHEGYLLAQDLNGIRDRRVTGAICAFVCLAPDSAVKVGGRRTGWAASFSPGPSPLFRLHTEG